MQLDSTEVFLLVLFVLLVIVTIVISRASFVVSKLAHTQDNSEELTTTKEDLKQYKKVFVLLSFLAFLFFVGTKFSV